MKRTRPVLLASLALTVAVALYLRCESSPEAQSRPVADGSSTNEIEPAQATAQGLKMISFVHFNDFHAHYQPRNYSGQVLSPLSLLRGYRDQVKAENPNTLFCSAGDEMEKGSIVDFLSKGAATIEIYKELGLDLRAVGNHDFAYGLDTLKRFVSETTGVVLCANQSVAKDFHQFELDGVRIGVFAMVGQPWDERDEQYDGPYFKGVDYRYDTITLAKELVQKHRDQVDLLFLLSHLGLDTDRHLAAQVPGLDFIIGGHSHTLLTHPERASHGTVIVQAGSYGQYVGRLDVMVHRLSRKMQAYHYSVTSVNPQNMTPNLKLEEKIREICQRYDAQPEAPVTTLTETLSKAAVAKLAGQAAMAVLKADAAVIDLETVWGSLATGPRTRQDLLDAFRVEIEPSGTHGFSALMTANVREEDWQVMMTSPRGRFIFVGEQSGQGQKILRVAFQRRTAMRMREFFPQAAPPDSLRFEMEVWEALEKHLAARDLPGPRPASTTGR